MRYASAKIETTQWENGVKQLIGIAGTAAGALGMLFCLVAGLSRLSGVFYVAGVESTTVFMVGTGLMVFACLLKIELLGRA